MYLEISGRGTGKTYRLARAIAAYLSENKQNVANVVAASEHGAEWIKEQIKCIPFESDRIRYTTIDRKNPIVRGYRNVKNFYDEFDRIFKDPLKKNDPFFFGDLYKDDYYSTTASKV